MKSFQLFKLCLVAICFLLLSAKNGESAFEQKNGTDDKQAMSMEYCVLAKSLQYTNADSAMLLAQKGLELSESISYIQGMAESSAVLGDIFVINDQLQNAKKNYSTAVEYFESIDSLFDVTQISMILGNIHLAQNEYPEALNFYQHCLDIANKNNFTSLTPHLYNNMGELYLEIGAYEASKENFERAFVLFEKGNDQMSLAMCMTNLAHISGVNNDREAAIKGYLDGIRILSSMKSWANIASGYNAIANLFISEGDYKSASDYLGLALSIIDNNDNTFDGPSSIYSTRIYTNAAKLAIERGEMKEAMNFANKSLKLSVTNHYKESILENAKLLSLLYERSGQKDSALVYYRTALQFSDEIKLEENVKKITQLRMQHEFDTMMKKKELEEVKKEAEHRQRELFYIVIMIIIALIILVLLLLFRNLKAKNNRTILQKENLELEKTKLNQELSYKNKELATNVMYLLEKNEFITNIAKQLGEAKDDFNKSNQSVVQKIINELKQNSTQKIWEEFEVRFKEVHSDFYEKLNERFPDLTPNEIRICAFLRLNMSTKEISAITHQSVKSLNMARFRLRKKMGIDKEENLITVLTQIQ